MAILGAIMKDAVKRSLVALLLVLAGCGAPPVPAAPVPLTERVIAVVAEEHLGEAFAAFSASIDDEHEPDAIGAAVHYRATAANRLWSASVTYGPSMRMIEGRCDPLSTEAPQPTCVWQDGVRVAWLADTSSLYLTSPRKDESVNISVHNLPRRDDPRGGTGPVILDKLVALAKDPRLDGTTDATLAARALAYPRWTDDPGCNRTAPTGPIPQPAASGPATEPIAPRRSQPWSRPTSPAPARRTGTPSTRDPSAAWCSSRPARNGWPPTCPPTGGSAPATGESARGRVG